ncbi:SRPBCC family protein [Methylobacterium sp. E-066]|uniref:SRPBCC family protein n=1 Tax=Methylobacterium sp. E-066 TaxID=2836584 RepID=UPI001FBAA4D9|nr:SRPBCC family protein [Methylobacterium sp. E-066]MCJ2139978.1 SRPBCC family protein [Methylobacterium sp. E-066]
MAQERITVEAIVNAPIEAVWKAYTTPDQITQWNFASDDWHCPNASVDLREGGKFTSRMEAKDGSMGFDFEGIFTKIIPNERIEYAFGDRSAVVEFTPEGEKTSLKVSFDPENQFPIEQQRSGWTAILNNLCKHVEGH